METWVLSNATLPPVTTSKGDGYLDLLYAEWFSRAGLSVELTTAPASRGLLRANAGLIDGDAARINLSSAEFPNLRKIPEPVTEVVFTGFFLQPGVEVRTPADFEKYRVGYVRGWSMAEQMFGDNTEAIAVKGAEILIDMLMEKRIEIAYLTLAPTRAIARDRGLDTLKTTDYRLLKKFYLYVHSKHYDRIPELTNTLKAMKNDGSYDRIMANYFAENQ